MRYWKLTGLVCAGSIALAGTVTQGRQTETADIITPDALGANFEAAKTGRGTVHDYDFLVGEWRFRFQQRNDDGTYRPPQEGVWVARKAYGGTIIEDSWRLGNTNNPTVTYRVFNPDRQLWEIQGTKPLTGGWDTGVSWASGDQRMVVQRFGGGKLLVRIRYYEVTTTRFRWRADGSLDEGKSWTPDLWKMEAVRSR